MDSNLRGAVVEQAIALEATRLRVPVWLPAAEHGRVDMLFEIGGRTWKVQCKSGHLTASRDLVVVRLRSCRRTANGYIRRPYAEHEVDLIAVYCEELNRSFLLPVSMTAGLTAIQLRLKPPRNGQRACINLADDFDFVGAIAQLGERVTGSHEVAGSSPASSTIVSLFEPLTKERSGVRSFWRPLAGGVDRAAHSCSDTWSRDIG